MMGGSSGCTICHGQIFGAPVKIGASLYHQKCFVCSKCNCKLQLSSYSVSKDKLYCSTCYKAVALRNVDASADSGLMVEAIRGGKTSSAPHIHLPPKVPLDQPVSQQYGLPQGTPAAAPAAPAQASPASKFCNQCGTRVEGAGRFCHSCGAKLV
eukprot:m51a1_g9472 hypothetical protein (154) ;mRNA; f:582378-583259